MGFKGFPGGLDSKESACNAGDPGSIPGLRRSLGEGNGTLLQYSSLVNPHGQRSLVGYSPCGPKESDVTERLTRSYFPSSPGDLRPIRICWPSLWGGDGSG